MRIGQFARKFNLPVTEIFAYLEQVETPDSQSLHPNAKLDDQLGKQVLDHFGVEIPTTPEPDPVPLETTNQQEKAEITEAPEAIEESTAAVSPVDIESQTPVNSKPQTPAEEIAAAEGEIAQPADDHQSDPADQDPREKTDEKKPNSDQVISTDRFLELMESEDPIDHEKFQLIKASKRELAGLKVVGKVDLPEPRKRQEKENISEDGQKKNNRQRRQQLSEEEKEKSRLKAKRKKEAYEARQREIEAEKEVQRLKALKEKHYRKKLQEQQPAPKTNKESRVKKVPEVPVVRKKVKQEKPKSLLGRFWKWMNT